MTFESQLRRLLMIPKLLLLHTTMQNIMGLVNISVLTGFKMCLERNYSLCQPVFSSQCSDNPKNKYRMFAKYGVELFSCVRCIPWKETSTKWSRDVRTQRESSKLCLALSLMYEINQLFCSKAVATVKSTSKHHFTQILLQHCSLNRKRDMFSCMGLTKYTWPSNELSVFTT